MAYWGHPEPRITGLTLKIMGVNAAALIMLLLGILYLGQYQNELIEAKLETFNAEVQLIAAAIGEGASIKPDIPAWQPIEETKDSTYSPILSEIKTRKMGYRFGQMSGRQIYIFNTEGKMIADSSKLDGPGGEIDVTPLAPPDAKPQNDTPNTLKKMARWVLKIFTQRKELPRYPETNLKHAKHHPNVLDAINGSGSISVWNNNEKQIILSTTAPIRNNGTIIGGILMNRRGHDIEEDLGKVWSNILIIFSGTLVITTILSIYLSGVIARPLRKLAKAAEAVRRGKSKAAEIPDLSDRNDEIGELSIALRQMTNALWERMDTIENFAADVSHELKNPLTSLRSAIETLTIVKDEAKQNKLMRIIEHDLERLDRLISDISMASRLDAELSREATETVNLKTVLNNLIERYKTPLERSKEQNSATWDNKATLENQTITLDSSENKDIIVPGRESRLTQVFENLIVNALSFSPENGTITISVKPKLGHVIITIEDQGPGIPETKLETIFDRFYSERPDHEQYGQHSGLGLSICRQIIFALDGRITAENITDQNTEVTGARFSIILPSL